MTKEHLAADNILQPLLRASGALACVATITCALGAVRHNADANEAQRAVLEAVIEQDSDVEMLQVVAERREEELEAYIYMLAGSAGMLSGALLFMKSSSAPQAASKRSDKDPVI